MADPVTDPVQSAGAAVVVRESSGTRVATAVDHVFRNPVLGPLAALVLACVAFSLFTDNFLSVDNLSLILQQSVVVGTLALGQTLIVLTGGIDLANGAIMVLGTLVIARTAAAATGQVTALLLGLLVCAGLGAVSGLIVSRLGLPPFIVTLGLLTILQAASRLYTRETVLVEEGPLTLLSGGGYFLGRFQVTAGVVVVLLSVLVLHYALTRTAWGRHVYAVGNNDLAAKRTGIDVKRVLLSVYVLAGALYALAALQAFGRSPATSPNAFPTANLDTITAVVIGGTSLFGGRGTVLGTYIGALIVLVLQSGLTQAGIDPLYQNIVTGILVIAAVALDSITRRRAR
ncbi:ABC transporter permease [Kineococcus indalonis]|uniref:ABC transporter permease n=1 Tax=Kineococcus indalonis TaxID=2696566 RepID=UPI0014136E64|nr:ABC transporter permease [Kineococcus indalonis]NAZ86587.1 ABC transporter permease [Kineococcus indalonis]